MMLGMKYNNGKDEFKVFIKWNIIYSHQSLNNITNIINTLFEKLSKFNL